MRISTQSSSSPVSKYPNMTSLNPLTVQISSLMFKSIDGGMIICEQTSDHLNGLFLHLFKKNILSSLWSFIPIFSSMVETCVYNSYILWLTKLKCFREISSKTKTKGHFTCVCETDHLFTKQRASELMIWLRYAIEVKYFLYCA